MLKTLLTKNYGVVEAEIDNELQANNQHTEWGMYLIKVNGGVVWGYDVDKYVYVGNEIVKKTSLDKVDNE